MYNPINMGSLEGPSSGHDSLYMLFAFMIKCHKVVSCSL